jgi:hypothetical protein
MARVAGVHNLIKCGTAAVAPPRHSAKKYFYFFSARVRVMAPRGQFERQIVQTPVRLVSPISAA